MNDMKFLELFRRFIKYHENTCNYFDKRKAGTINSYYNRYNLTVEFLHEKKMMSMLSQEFKISVARNFFNWLGEQGKSHNYCVRVVQAAGAVLAYGAANELILSNPLSAMQMKKVPPGDPVHLTIEEIIKLEEYNPKNSMLKKAKDLFLFQCVTGLDYGDLTTVGRVNLITHEGNNTYQRGGTKRITRHSFLISQKPNRFSKNTIITLSYWQMLTTMMR